MKNKRSCFLKKALYSLVALFITAAFSLGMISYSFFQSNNFPSWSPDGCRIVFDATVGEGTDIFIMNADGTNQMKLIK